MSPETEAAWTESIESLRRWERLLGHKGPELDKAARALEVLSHELPNATERSDFRIAAYLLRNRLSVSGHHTKAETLTIIIGIAEHTIQNLPTPEAP